MSGLLELRERAQEAVRRYRETGWLGPIMSSTILERIILTTLTALVAEIREEDAKIADQWALSKSCAFHDDNPCCHVRTGYGIATAIRAKQDQREKDV